MVWFCVPDDQAARARDGEAESSKFNCRELESPSYMSRLRPFKTNPHKFQCKAEFLSASWNCPSTLSHPIPSSHEAFQCSLHTRSRF